MGVIAEVVNALLRPTGYVMLKQVAMTNYDFEKEYLPLAEQCAPYTLTTPERLYNLHLAVKYVVQHQIPGDFVECGVWKGGSSMMIALTLRSLGVTDRRLHLFDTYEGMTAPTAEDIRARDGASALEQYKGRVADGRDTWIKIPLEDVRANMARTGYPSEHVQFIKGPVEQTIPGAAPDRISLLRLDTDWYESTRHEFEHLYPRLSPLGVLIVDDYGYWQGARQATDEYLRRHALPLLLQRVDNTCRVAIKPA